jgi:glycolate oxidase FAD binding subunit
MAGVIAHDVADQVVTVWAGTRIEDLNAEMASAGQCIPYAPGPLTKGGTVGGRLSLNLPHALEAACGTWRDWVLGLTVVRADGTIAKAGSKAVKNVAGYDVQKLLVGARGALAVVAQVILRTYPVKALPPLDVEVTAEVPALGAIQRVLRSDLDAASASPDIVALHRATATIYRRCESLEKVPRFEHDWLLGWGLGSGNVLPLKATEARLMRRAKSILDPAGKLNPGEWPL